MKFVKFDLTRFRRAAALIGVAAGLAVSGSARAAVYTYDFTYNTTTPTCAISGGVRNCYEFQVLPEGTFGNGGDQFNVNVHLSGSATLIVPGSRKSNFFFVDLFDSKWGQGGTQTDIAKGTITPFGFSGPGYPLGAPGIPLTLSNNHFFSSLLGFCCGYHSPNSGWSITGADATLNLQNSDPNPLTFILVGTAVAVPEPATWSLMLAGLAGLGGALRLSRKQAALAAD